MSSRITRSAARLAAEPPPPATSGPTPAIPAAGSAPSRKRKAHTRSDRSVEAPGQPNPPSPPRRAKKQRRAASPQPAAASAPPRRFILTSNGGALKEPAVTSDIQKKIEQKWEGVTR
ncbi:putative ubiquitin-protein ligase Ufd4 [Aspergillus bombycis]|uniref:Putative ubiquitin-protein ligase Ufd4 n=1 Tax=Aspergillus bombycis TaxID=109264 RepID=A0A1F8A1Q3_9EURO|nr:putative ubiquitin-protein ligase Ufd4 [Aspergillus bombycis]OGM45238.1 putative ubiquitin-protein ligase Ufd4 [Aspergillus bombycis]